MANTSICIQLRVCPIALAFLHRNNKTLLVEEPLILRYLTKFSIVDNIENIHIMFLKIFTAATFDFLIFYCRHYLPLTRSEISIPIPGSSMIFGSVELVNRYCISIYAVPNLVIQFCMFVSSTMSLFGSVKSLPLSYYSRTFSGAYVRSFGERNREH